MPRNENVPAHPGPYIKEYVLPAGMSVTEAAKRLGVGRPALSNLLNGNASLSPEMSIRLEKAFGSDRLMLLEMQVAFDRHERQAKDKTISARAYVPDFLTIKARQIDQWPDNNLSARQLLPVLLRRLVHSTGQELSRVDFPGYDNAEDKGLDGRTNAHAASPWVPLGMSCWEFGVDKNPGRKAARVYAARAASISATERQESTFVFVTPRRWGGKKNWVERKNAAGDWNEVRAYDASDLEQWLEESIPAQMWFAEILGMEVEGFQTLERFWDEWSSDSQPSLSQALFEPQIAARLNDFRNWLGMEPERAFVIAADSKQEALAFLACLFRRQEVKSHWGDLPVIFESASTLRKLLVATAPFIPIVYTDEVERELGGMDRQRHCIVVRPRNTVGMDSGRILDRLDYESFLNALATMGFDREKAKQLARESARSPTILRRRLSPRDAIRTPSWAKDVAVAKSLVPIVLTGVWHSDSEPDRAVLSLVGDRPYREIENSIGPLLDLDDAPVWSKGQYRGVVSKIDALFAISGNVTQDELNDFLLVAELVLSEVDPALDLPEDKRWAAGIYGKVREHSDALRANMCETLVILSVHGDSLFRDRLGMSVETGVHMLIRKLLEPLSLEKLLSQDVDLPRYAEAAPRAFLEVIEEDLARSEPVMRGLFQPAGAGPFSSPSRTGLLWALECLAWKSPLEVSLILSKLSSIEINDNWTNKPINSLLSIFKCWIPQTAASLEERVKSLELLKQRFPDIAWMICMDQLIAHSQILVPSYRPRWRSDATGAGQVQAKKKEIRAFIDKALQLALGWEGHDGKMLGNLVERIHILNRNAQERVWNLIDAWAKSEADDGEKQKLAGHIRRFVLTRRASENQSDELIKDRARAAWEGLRSGNPAVRHAWLFAERWLDLSAEDLEDEDIDGAYKRHYKKVDTLRAGAIREIWDICDFEGIESVVGESGAPDIVGDYLARHVRSTDVQVDILRMCLAANDGLDDSIDGFMRGFLARIEVEARRRVIVEIVSGDDTEVLQRVFRCAPFAESTWRLLNDFGDEAVSKYWQEVNPYVQHHNDAELLEMVDRLLDAKRPRAAFNAVQYDWSRIETLRLKRLLRDVASVDNEPEGHYQISPHHLSKALIVLGERNGVSEEEMAQLEFHYAEVLDVGDYRLTNLERQISRVPSLFVQILALVFKRNDGRRDPSDWKLQDSQRKRLSSAGYRILDRIALNPDKVGDGSINVQKMHDWVSKARELCSEYGRSEIGDQYIGQLLARMDVQDGSGKPSVCVCDVMERVASKEIGVGYGIAVSNSRGVHIRGEGGSQERDLAEKYLGWAKELKFNYPHVGGVLEEIAASYDREARWHDERSTLQDILTN